MKILNQMTAISLLFLFFFASCHKDHPNNNIPDFPGNIGTNWKYSVFDSAHYIADTQTVIISGKTTLNDGRPAEIVKSYYSFRNDTTYEYLFQGSDRIIFYTSKEGVDYNKIYVYPLKVGASWPGENILDTNKVIAQENITTPAGTFSSSIINRNFKVTNMVLAETEWYVSGIGMVQRNYYERNIGYILYTSYKLLSYHIAK